MLPVELTIYVFFVYILAGFVKGVVGVGLPTISLAMLAIFLGLKEAMLILLAPSLAPSRESLALYLSLKLCL